MGGSYERLPVFNDPGTPPPRLSQLSSGMDWSAHEHPDQETDPHGRGYGALAYMAERYGFPATVRLLHENHDGGTENFRSLLTGLTGMDEDGLDDALSDWLAAPGRVVLRDEFSRPSGHWWRWENMRSTSG